MWIKGSYCPICNLRCVICTHVDFVVCPEHGQMSAMLQLNIVGMIKWKALIELRAEQYKQELALMRFKYDEQASQFCQRAVGLGWHPR